MINKLKKIVEIACKKKSNHFGYSAWNHISSVVEYATILADQLNADKEIVQVAAILHDYASVVNRNWYSEHHIHGARLAGDILKKYNYPKDKIEKIQHCILAHRGSKKIKRKTIEAKIIASADSMAHFNNIDSLFYVAYVVHKLKVNEAKKWVLAKLDRSWKKLMPEGKKVVMKKYKSIKQIFAQDV